MYLIDLKKIITTKNCRTTFIEKHLRSENVDRMIDVYDRQIS